MSRKGFIITALVLNLIICLSICVMKFATTDNSKEKESSIEADTSSEIFIQETTTMSVEELYTSDFESEDKEDETTTKIVEQQAGKETTKRPETTNQETTVQETTSSEPAVNGTVAVINSSCNIRTTKDVGGEVIGTANAGNTYTIDPSQCNGNWIAILYDGQTVGFISSGFCTIQ